MLFLNLGHWLLLVGCVNLLRHLFVCLCLLIFGSSLSHQVEDFVYRSVLVVSPSLVVLRLHQSFIRRIGVTLRNLPRLLLNLLSSLLVLLVIEILRLSLRSLLLIGSLLIIRLRLLLNFFEPVLLSFKHRALVVLSHKDRRRLGMFDELEKLCSVILGKLIFLKLIGKIGKFLLFFEMTFVLSLLLGAFYFQEVPPGLYFTRAYLRKRIFLGIREFLELGRIVGETLFLHFAEDMINQIALLLK